MQKKILSSTSSLKFFDKKLSEDEIIDVLSDIKHRIFPRPFERLSCVRDKKNLVGIEIGVAGGEHALSLLETLDIKKLYLIDPYDLYDGYDEGKKHFDVDQLNISETKAAARNLLAEYHDKIIWIEDLSDVACNNIKDQVDFVYIDGNHQYEYVQSDIENYFKLIKSGGVLGGHDYYNGFQREHDGVVKAVTSFVNKSNNTLRVELPDWWLEL